MYKQYSLLYTEDVTFNLSHIHNFVPTSLVAKVKLIKRQKMCLSPLVLLSF